jgi:hypothetical protein
VRSYEAISALGTENPVKLDPDDLQKQTFWIEPYATVIFREYNESEAAKE